MRRRVTRSRQPGQSIVLIALILLLLVAMVGMSVDVGNTYAEQRATVRATDAAALAAVNKLIGGGSDADIAAIIRGAFESNGITPLDPGAGVAGQGQRLVDAYYLDNKGQRLADCPVGKCGRVPRGVTYIQVNSRGTVDTFFARAVGQTTLPVNALSYATRCAPSDNVYPIAIRQNDLNARGFIPPPDAKNYVGVRDQDYPQMLFQRRIYLNPVGGAAEMGPGSFNFLRWSSADTLSSNWLARAFTGAGILRDGFEEVPAWPIPGEAVPNGYPTLPNQLSQGDWLYAYPGWPQDDAALRANLDNLIRNRTKLILPIVKRGAGLAVDGQYEFSRLGAFRLVGYSRGEGQQPAYLDLIYLQDAGSVACQVTNFEDLVSQQLSFTGQVQVRPQWIDNPESDRPIAFVVLMDFSGSMSWNFSGWGQNTSGTPWQCETYEGTPGSPPDGRFTNNCRTGPNANSPWSNVNEWRLTIAKQGLKQLVNSMRQGDTMRLIGFSDGFRDSDSFNNQNYKWVRAFPTEREVTQNPSLLPGATREHPGWTGDKGTLRTIIDKAGVMTANGQLYPAGGTAGANGVMMAKAMLDKAPKTWQSPGGEKEYRKVLIYLTDGVANMFRSDTTGLRSDQYWNNWFNKACPSITNSHVIANSPECQINPLEKEKNDQIGKVLPITQMTELTGELKTKYGSDLQIFTVMMGSASATGLDRMASGPQWALVARQPADVKEVFDQIITRVQLPCVALNSETYLSTIQGKNMPDPGAPIFQGQGLGGSTVGQAYLYFENGDPLPEPFFRRPITLGVDGTMSFSTPPGNGLAPGDYQMRAFVGYKGEDGINRSYSSISSTGQSSSVGLGTERVTFTVTPQGAFGGTVNIGPVLLDLAPTVKLCP